MSKESKARSRSPIMLDCDGVAIDDITPHFEKRLSESKSWAGATFDAFLYNAFRNFLSTSAKLIRKDGEELLLDPQAARFMLRHGDEGHAILLGTANPLYKKEELEELLKKDGIKNAEVHVVTNRQKIAIALRHNAILIEDDPWVAGEAARAGVRVILLRKRYNRGPGNILSAINPKIKMAENWGEIPRIVARMDGGQLDS